MMSWKHEYSLQKMSSPMFSFLLEILPFNHLPKLTKTVLFLVGFNKHTRTRHLLFTRQVSNENVQQCTSSRQISLRKLKPVDENTLENFLCVFFSFLFFFPHSRMHELDIASCLSQQYPNWFLN